jgi:succinate dehydrogenase/fumarate reductase flavoprotein subunit
MGRQGLIAFLFFSREAGGVGPASNYRSGHCAYQGWHAKALKHFSAMGCLAWAQVLADPRAQREAPADVFAFGVVLYEIMLVGN